MDQCLLRDRPDRTRRLMEAHVADAEVSGYESMIDTITLPDPDDRHVVATAIRGGASVILTVNLRDFPAAALAPYHLTTQHPDAFLVGLLEADRSAVLTVMRRHRQSLKNPPKTPAEYVATFEKHGMNKLGIKGAISGKVNQNNDFGQEEPLSARQGETQALPQSAVGGGFHVCIHLEWLCLCSLRDRRVRKVLSVGVSVVPLMQALSTA